MYALILSGLAMQMVGNSRPASCAEHHLSHLWEMEVINGRLDALHGEKVSVGTLLVLERYKQIARAIRNGECRVIPYEDRDAELREKVFGEKGILQGIAEENTPELLLEVSPSRLRDSLSTIADIIEDLPEEEELIQAMNIAGCKKSVYGIGLTEEIIPISLRLAPYVRRRLSFLRVSKMLKMEEEV